MKILAKWLRFADRDSIASLEKRHLLPRTTEPDQVALLHVRDVTTLLTLTHLMHELYPVYATSVRLIESLSQAEETANIDEIVLESESQAHVPPRIRARLSRP